MDSILAKLNFFVRVDQNKNGTVDAEEFFMAFAPLPGHNHAAAEE